MEDESFVICLEVDPSFTGGITVEVRLNEFTSPPGGRLRVSDRRWDAARLTGTEAVDDAAGKERELSSEEVGDLLSELVSASVPLLPPEQAGLDGTTYTLSIRRVMSELRYSWWTTPPPRWRALERMATRLLELAEGEEGMMERRGCQACFSLL